uniref:Fucosyltransferase n=1 Tax=Plectus sambesii TaxID=2011161 RepID=A0A914XBC0_9BILA
MNHRLHICRPPTLPFDSAAAILFHSAAWDLSLNDLPTSRQPEQYFVYYNQEPPPKSSWRDLEGFLYEEHGWDDVVAAVRRKTKLGLQFVGNCYSESGRESIIRALQRYISIDQFGYCVGRQCDYSCEQRILPNYRFFIAFENNICRDYVTEKFWSLKRLIVPIVLRASILDGIAPDDSFIAVDQFQSVAALAAHLEMLSRNETEYLRYFEWTRHYQKIEAPRSEAFCRLCDRLHAPTIKHKSYADLVAWYYPVEICQAERFNYVREVLYMWGRFIALCTLSFASALLLCAIVIRKCLYP